MTTTAQPTRLDSCPAWCARTHDDTGPHYSAPIVAAENDDDPERPLVIEILRDDLATRSSGTWLDLCDVQKLRPSEARRYAAALIQAAELAERDPR